MNAAVENIKSGLPQGFAARGASLEDVEPALEMFNAWSQAVIREDEITDAGIIRNEWVTPGFDPARDIRVVFSPDGTLVGYIEVWTIAKPPVHPWIWGRVHPGYSGLGLGTWLLGWAEVRACLALEEVPAGLRCAPRLGINRPARDSKRLFEDMGFAHIRSSYDMQIDLETEPAAPTWSGGIRLGRFEPDRDMQAVYAADRDSFRDHFGYVEEPFEEGLARFSHLLTGEGFDPTSWFLAMDGDEIAGICLCRPGSQRDPDLGFVNILGVRRAWRRRGVGLALLRHSFGEFYRRGRRGVGLGVDADNLTGALRLYEQAGMHVHMAFDLYEKMIRPGREISVESLSE